MAGVDVGGGGGGGRKKLDSEINMVPFIDLLMVTISFLLLTAVWSHMARLNADAQVPGPPRPDEQVEKTEPEKQLHVEMRSADKFTLIWKQGATVVSSVDVPQGRRRFRGLDQGRSLQRPRREDRARVEDRGPAPRCRRQEVRHGGAPHGQRDPVLPARRRHRRHLSSEAAVQCGREGRTRQRLQRDLLGQLKEPRCPFMSLAGG